VESLRSTLGNIPNPLDSLEVSQDGEWRKLRKVINYMSGSGFGQGIKRDIAKAQRDWLTKMKGLLVKTLLSKGASSGKSFPPLSSGYSRRREMGVHSGHYLNSLQAIKIIQKNYNVSLFIPRGMVLAKPQGGYTLGQYAAIFEAGSSRQPPRPLWNQTYAKMGGPKGVLKVMNGAIGKRLRSMGVKIRVR